MVNYRCPCCSYPIMPPGVVTEYGLFRVKIIDQELFSSCTNCKTRWRAKFYAHGDRHSYREVHYYDIVVPDRVIAAINKVQTQKRSSL
jgi:hypothetical protein